MMFDVGKGRTILVACCLNNLYGCYASLQTFLNFLFMKKQRKINQIVLKIISTNTLKSSKKKGKRNSQGLDRLAHGGINFALVKKSLTNEKKISASLKKV